MWLQMAGRSVCSSRIRACQINVVRQMDSAACPHETMVEQLREPSGRSRRVGAKNSSLQPAVPILFTSYSFQCLRRTGTVQGESTLSTLHPSHIYGPIPNKAQNEGRFLLPSFNSGLRKVMDVWQSEVGQGRCRRFECDIDATA